MLVFFVCLILLALLVYSSSMMLLMSDHVHNVQTLIKVTRVDENVSL